jgi:hypothetical protein
LYIRYGSCYQQSNGVFIKKAGLETAEVPKKLCPQIINNILTNFVGKIHGAKQQATF